MSIGNITQKRRDVIFSNNALAKQSIRQLEKKFDELFGPLDDNA